MSAIIGTVGRTFTAKLSEFASVLDFGAVNDGSADASAGIQAALNGMYADYPNGVGIDIPAGTYRLDSAITWPTGASGLALRVKVGVVLTGTGSLPADAGGNHVYTEGGSGSVPAPVVLKHTLTANYAPSLSAPTMDGQTMSWKLTQDATGGWSVDWTNGGANPVELNTFPAIASTEGDAVANTYCVGQAIGIDGKWHNVAATLGVPV